MQCVVLMYEQTYALLMALSEKGCICTPQLPVGAAECSLDQMLISCRCGTPSG